MRELTSLVMNITGGMSAAHAYIVEGPAGNKRDDFIMSLAQGLECTCNDAAERPCGVCPSCRQVRAGTSMDVVRMNKSQGSGKTTRAVYKVDDAAGFIERLSMGSYGRFLIGIIDDADSLSEVIQNKLLKTLEEPGMNTILLLAASNRDNLLGTVRSRCGEIRVTDYIGYTAADDEYPGEADASGNNALNELADRLTDQACRFYEFRNAADKHIKSREDALALLDLVEDKMRREMTSSLTASAADLQTFASVIELCAEARMDIRREMTYGKTLKRLFLELRRRGR